ncbi:hypothetical protein D3C85_977610 [compost metagenome]
MLAAPVQRRPGVGGDVLLDRAQRGAAVAGAGLGAERQRAEAQAVEDHGPAHRVVSLGQGGEAVARSGAEGRARPALALPGGEGHPSGGDVEQGFLPDLVAQPGRVEGGVAVQDRLGRLDRRGGDQRQLRSARTVHRHLRLAHRRGVFRLIAAARRDAVGRAHVDAEQAVVFIIADGRQGVGPPHGVAERSADIGARFDGDVHRPSCGLRRGRRAERLEGLGDVQQAAPIDDVGSRIPGVASGSQQDLHRLLARQIGEGLEQQGQGARHGGRGEGSAVGDPA